MSQSWSDRQHYIPRFYLKNFADGKPKRFWQMDRSNLSITEVNPERKCWKRRIYAETTDKYLEQIEDNTSGIIRSLIKDGIDSISIHGENRVKELIWSLYLRSLEWGDIRDDEQGKRKIPCLMENDMRLLREDWLIENPDFMSPFPKSKISDYNLYYFSNHSKFKFCTSDCPAYRLIIDRKITVDTFLDHGKGLAFYLPLSPKLATIAVPVDRMKDRPWSRLPKLTQINDADFPVLMNLKACFNSEELSFAANREDLQLCKEIIVAAPEKIPSETLALTLLDKLVK